MLAKSRGNIHLLNIILLYILLFYILTSLFPWLLNKCNIHDLYDEIYRKSICDYILISVKLFYIQYKQAAFR